MNNDDIKFTGPDPEIMELLKLMLQIQQQILEIAKPVICVKAN